MEVVRHGPLITPDSHPEAGTNINGPSLVRVPDWVDGERIWLLYCIAGESGIALAEITGL